MTLTSGMRPVPVEEQTILQQLYDYRHKLQELRKKTHDTLTLEDINHECNLLSKIMENLRQVRENSYAERNRLDDVLDTIWLSLFQIWGKIAGVEEDVYPIYSQLAGINKTLETYKKTGVFLVSDVQVLQHRVDTIENSCKVDGKFMAGKTFDERWSANVSTEQPPAGQAIIQGALHRIHRSIHFLLSSTDSISAELEPTYNKLVSVAKQLQELKKLKTYTVDQVRHLQHQLDEMDVHRDQKTGGFAISNQQLPPGQACLMSMLSTAYEDCYELVSAKDEVDGALRPLYEQLSLMKEKLETILASTDRFTISQETITTLQTHLNQIDSKRQNGIFPGAVPGSIPPGQAVLHYLLHQCYGYVHRLMFAQVPVSDALLGAYDILIVTKEKLRSLKRKAKRQEFSHLESELNSISDTLRAIENSKQNGIFWGVVTPAASQVEAAISELLQHHASPHALFASEKPKSTEPPAGQAVIQALLDECFVRLGEIRVLLP